MTEIQAQRQMYRLRALFDARTTELTNLRLEIDELQAKRRNLLAQYPLLDLNSAREDAETSG